MNTMEFTHVVELVAVESSCGHVIYMTADFKKQRQRDHNTFFCTTCGSRRHWPGESDIEKLRRERDAALQREETIRQQRLELERHQITLRRQLSAAHGQTTKIKNRVSKGVCPCCNRTFENLQRHMASKHADYATPSV